MYIYPILKKRYKRSNFFGAARFILNMKINLIFCTILLLTGGLSALPVSAQDAAAPSPAAAPERGHRLDFLAPAEKEQYLKDLKQVMDSNATLKAQGEALKADAQSMKGTTPTADEKKAFHEKRKAFDDALNQAIVQLDPSAKPIVDKIVAHHSEMKGGAPATPPAQ